MPRSGVIGEQIYDQVEKLVAGGMNRTQAFAEISRESGRQAGTVAANYYRVARKRAGGSLRPRTRRSTRSTTRSASRSTAARRGARAGRATRRAPAQASGDIDALAAQLISSVEALAAAVKSQAQQVKEMQARLDGVKKLLT
jgi:hypothetical protein